MGRGFVLLSALLLTGMAEAQDLAVRFPGPGDLSPFRLSGSVARYTPETLWERIDGEAELYRRFGLREAAAAYFERPESQGRTLEISLFDMGSPLGAFGLFASFRPPGAPAADIGNGGWLGDSLAVLWHGRYFATIHADGPEGERRGDLLSAADAVVARLGPAPARPAELTAFEALADPATVRYHPEHLLGRQALPPGIEGVDPDGRRVFVATSPADSSAVFPAYREILRDARAWEDRGVRLLSGTDPHVGAVTLAAQGPKLAGLCAPADAPGGAELLRGLLGLGPARSRAP